MSSNRHSPGPWAAGTDTTRGAMTGRVHITNARGLRIGWTITPEDCAFIVRACNAHDDLLELAQRYSSECAECSGTGVTVENVECPECRDIRAAIAKAVA